MKGADVERVGCMKDGRGRAQVEEEGLGRGVEDMQPGTQMGTGEEEAGGEAGVVVVRVGE